MDFTETPFEFPASGNPFLPIDLSKIPKKRAMSDEEFYSQMESFLRTSLVERTLSKKPRVLPMVTSRKTKTVSTLSSPEPKAHRGRTLSMSEKIQLKRAIYRFQLTIENKLGEISQLDAAILQEKKSIEDQSNYIDQTIEDQKNYFHTHQYEMVQQKNKAHEASTVRRSLQNGLNAKRTFIEQLRSSIEPLEETLLLYKSYRDFLQMMVPLEDPFTYFKKRDQLLDLFDALAGENLVIFQFCNELEENLEKGTTSFIEAISRIKDEQKKRIAQIFEKEKYLKELLKENYEYHFDLESGDSKLRSLKCLISNAYEEIFHEKGDMHPIEMLIRIEKEFIELDANVANVDSGSVIRILNEAEKERRNQNRIEKLKELQKEIQLKIAKATQRAKQPIPIRGLRKTNQRFLPLKHNKHLESELERREKETKRERALLFDEFSD